jgi:hypothetical protein
MLPTMAGETKTIFESGEYMGVDLRFAASN